MISESFYLEMTGKNNSSEWIKLLCPTCCKEFERQVRYIKSKIKHGTQDKKIENFCCSIKCASKLGREALQNKYNYDIREVFCGNCNKKLHRSIKIIKMSKSGHVFCSQSCSATYNNTHKTYGYRRSKAEIFVEEQLKINFPGLVTVCNDKKTIGSELDFYFPDIKFAIELNGIFHYEPIYGDEKLNQIQTNDARKFLGCQQKGISLAVVDISWCEHLTTKNREKIWFIIKNVLKLHNETINSGTRI